MKRIAAFLLTTSCVTVQQPIVQQNEVINENTIEISCSGSGVSVDFSRLSALESCKKLAASYFSSNIKVANKIYETNDDVYVLNKAHFTYTYDNLRCMPIKENTYAQTNSFFTQMRCKFNVKDVKANKEELQFDIVPVWHNEEQERESVIPILKDKYFILFVKSVPKCDFLVVIGKEQKRISCNENPQSIRVTKDDHTVIVQAKDHLPQEINIKNSKHLESFTTFLEKTSF